jgi:hypothetical protein
MLWVPLVFLSFCALESKPYNMPGSHAIDNSLASTLD